MGNIFEHHIKVANSEIDELNHVNNEVYLKWLLSAATAHSAALGYSVSKFLEGGGVFVVRRHELEYLRPAYLGEELIIETWLADFEIMKTTRKYRIKRKADGKTILTASTLWVYVDFKSGRPTEIPQSIFETYRPYLIGKEANSS